MSITLIDPRLSVAPMLDRTDRHFRYFIRLISKHVLLYTEMITTGALIHGERDRYLAYHPQEHPLAVQLGGSDPADLAICSRMAADYGYDEINLNVGCPSDRVQANRFGACLMNTPELVAECVASMQAVVEIPVTVKCRIGVDDKDQYEDLCHFIETVSTAGCRQFIIHARKAWLSGLSPKENREIPPLQYELVETAKRDYPDLTVVINGGFSTLAEVNAQLQKVDGVMIGRAIYQNPYLLAEADNLIFGDSRELPSRCQIMEEFFPYIEQHLQQGNKLAGITRHILGLFQGQPGARLFRRYLAENSYRDDADIAVLTAALNCVGCGEE